MTAKSYPMQKNKLNLHILLWDNFLWPFDMMCDTVLCDWVCASGRHSLPEVRWGIAVIPSVDDPATATQISLSFLLFFSLIANRITVSPRHFVNSLHAFWRHCNRMVFSFSVKSVQSAKFSSLWTCLLYHWILTCYHRWSRAVDLL